MRLKLVECIATNQDAVVRYNASKVKPAVTSKTTDSLVRELLSAKKNAESRRLSAYVFDARSQKRDMLQFYTVKVDLTLMLFRLNTIICGVKAIFITSK